MATNSANTKSYANLKNRVVYANRNFWSGLLFGIGSIAFAHEVIFHQILQWHHFYDLSTAEAGIFSDGLLVSFAWLVTVFSLFLFADIRRRNGLWMKRWIGAVFLGAGIFQLFDGLVHHKILQLHQIRYDVDLMPYDLIWNVTGTAFIAVGLVLHVQTRRVMRKKKKEGN